MHSMPEHGVHFDSCLRLYINGFRLKSIEVIEYQAPATLKSGVAGLALYAPALTFRRQACSNGSV